MKKQETCLRVMPDIANEAKARVAGTLDWVGMSEIEMPVLVRNAAGVVLQVPARVTAYVNLDSSDVRGIHMSRLYLHLDEILSEKALSPKTIQQVLEAFLVSHEDLSSHAMIKVKYDYMIRRKALASDNYGWKKYPVEVSGMIVNGEVRTELGIHVVYSSTCPCSAALARQLIQNQFEKDFSNKLSVAYDDVMQWLGTEQGICATPHSQRSTAEVKIRLKDGLCQFPVLALIDGIEEALQTPVQAAVKREDEQAFALLNGKNLMFCEDAGRRVQKALNEDQNVIDFWARVSHFESLHPHDAVAEVTKGVDGGFDPQMF